MAALFYRKFYASKFAKNRMSRSTFDSPQKFTDAPRFKILVTHPEVPKEALQIMSQGNDLVICHSMPPKRSEILRKAKGVHGIFWGSHDPLDKEVLDAVGPQLKCISTFTRSFDFVDVEELKKRKIALGHTTGVTDDAVADIAMGLMLAAARRFHEARKNIDSSTWENYHYEWMCGQDIRNSTVGFFGFGGIGQTIAKRLKGFDIDCILYTTPIRISEELENEFFATKVDFPKLLADSDILFITATLTPETTGIFNYSALSKMKMHAIVINIARGPIINQDDLYTVLKEDKIFAAGIDVMYPEPLPADHKLLTLPNLVVTPHIATATKSTRTEMAVMAAYNIIKGLAGEPMPSPAY